jgi:tetratricopeptide (TPR) repeat protein
MADDDNLTLSKKDLMEFVRLHVCAPLAAAFAAGAVQLQPPIIPTNPGGVVAAAIVEVCDGVKRKLSIEASWKVVVEEEAIGPDDAVIVARVHKNAAVRTVVDAVNTMIAARDAGLPPPFPVKAIVLSARDAVAACTANGITQYLSAAEHPFSCGLPAVVLRHRLRCRRAGHGVVELVFEGSLDNFKASLPRSIFRLFTSLEKFVVSRISSFAVDSGGERGFLPSAITPTSATGQLLMQAGIPEAAFPKSLTWVASDAGMARVSEFTSYVDVPTGRTLVPLSLWRVPRRPVDDVCAWAGDRKVNVSNGDVARAIRDDARTTMEAFLHSIEGDRRVALARGHRLSVETIETSFLGTTGLFVAFQGDVAALTDALEHVSHPAELTAEEVDGLRVSEMLYTALHRAVVKLQLPLARFLSENLPTFFDECLAKSVSNTDPDGDANHIANVVYREAGLPGDPLEYDWKDTSPHLSDHHGDQREIVAVEMSEGGHISVLVRAASTGADTPLAMDDTSFTADDKRTVESVVAVLMRHGVVTTPSLGRHLFGPSRRRDDESKGLRFRNLLRNSKKSAHDATIDYDVRNWFEAGRLFLGGFTLKAASTNDTLAWDLGNLLTAISRNRWLRKRLVMSSTGKQIVDDRSLNKLFEELENALETRRRDAHAAGMMTVELFDQCMATLIAVAAKAQHFGGLGCVAELKLIRQSPRFCDALLPACGAPFPSCVRLDGHCDSVRDALIGRDKVLRDITSRIYACEAGPGAGLEMSGSVHAIVGLGGIGKSALARQLCVQVRSHPACCPNGVFWISGESTTSFELGYRCVASQLNLAERLHVEPSREDLFAWMRLHGGWLLVVDNFDDPDGLKRCLPPVDARGHVVIASRLSSRPVHLRPLRGLLRGAGDEPTVVECLDLSAAASLLCTLRRHQGGTPATALLPVTEAEHVAAASLCDDVGRLPLAIEMAAAYMRWKGADFTFDEYRAQWQAQRKLAVEVPAAILWQQWLRDRGIDDATTAALHQPDVHIHGDLRARVSSRGELDDFLPSLSPTQRDDLWDALATSDDIPGADDESLRIVRTAWELSAKLLAAAERRMMEVLCNFCADNIHVDMIAACISHLPKDDDLRNHVFTSLVRFNGDVDVTEDIVACITCLPKQHELRKLKFDAASGDPDSVLCRAVDVVRACEGVLCTLANISLVTWVCSTSQVSIHRVLQVVVIREQQRLISVPNTAGGAIHILAACAISLGKGLEPLVKASKTLGRTSGAATELIQWLVHADAYFEKWKSAVADPTTRPRRLVASMIHLVDRVAAALEIVSRLDRARELCDVHLSLVQQHGLGGVVELASLARLARVLHKAGDIYGSELIARRHAKAVVQVYQRQCLRKCGVGALPLDVAVSWQCLAGALMGNGDLDESEKKYRDSLLILRSLDLATSRTLRARAAMSTTLRGLAMVLRTRRRLLECAEVYDELFPALEVQFGECDHAFKASSLEDAAEVSFALGNLSNAVALYDRSAAMFAKLQINGAVAVSWRKLASLRFTQRDLVSSAQLYGKSVAMLRRVHGEGADHDDIAASLQGHAEVLLAQDNQSNSARLHREALAMLRRLYGSDACRRDIAAALRFLAIALHASGDVTVAERLHREALTMFRQLIPCGAASDDREIAVSMRGLAEALYASGTTTGIEASRRLHREVLEIHCRLKDDLSDDRDFALTLRGLAEVLRASGELAESTRLHRCALEIFRRRRAVSTDHHDLYIAESSRGLAEALHSSGADLELQESEQLLRKALALFQGVYGVHADHRDIAMSMQGLAEVLGTQGEAVESARLGRRADAMQRRLL